jgi:DNA-binding response OmpR family regulator
VYGIVRQAGGHVTVSSAPGDGATFNVYLPARVPEMQQGQEANARDAMPGHETILFCEDHEPVRKLGEKILSDAGYRVLSAATGQEALDLAGLHGDAIALLLTDVILPDINGRSLSDRIHTERPGVRTLFISGYTSNVISHHGVLDEGVELLEKPFTRQQLLGRVREILDRGSGTENGERRT